METLRYTLLFLFLYSALLGISVSAASKRCHPEDFSALMKIKEGLGNPYVLTSWKADEDCCEWYCLECDERTNRVTALLISDDDEISTAIPSAIGSLPYLEYIVLRKLKSLHGPIPSSITKLKRLKSIRLSWNNFSGPVPDFFAELPNLEFLELNYNKFEGSIPSSFSKLTKLGALHLDRNKLTGTIPESYGHFTGSVPDLYLSHNKLTGSISKSFANMDFVRIDLSRNKLVGDASMLFKPNGKTETLDISRNMFEFDFSKVKFPRKSLISLDVNHNKLYGNIPKDIVKIDYLQLWNASYNRLCGKIPTGGDMARFDYSSYIHNKCLCGTPLSIKCD